MCNQSSSGVDIAQVALAMQSSSEADLPRRVGDKKAVRACFHPQESAQVNLDWLIINGKEIIVRHCSYFINTNTDVDDQFKLYTSTIPRVEVSWLMTKACPSMG